ncbi:MGMT family protein [Marisediminicola sp. LYQ85]|uniref:MGMT family protein n=1 Tax=Marisediminicola sp. LYQ85 TaxID=3391062 RepID=UPI003983903C
MTDAADDFVSRVLAVVDSIPAGRVMTYGDVAAAIGTRAARAVGAVLARYGSTVAWWRVVRADGRPAAGHEARALEHYLDEQTPLTSAGEFPRIALARARFSPD